MNTGTIQFTFIKSLNTRITIQTHFHFTLSTHFLYLPKQPHERGNTTHTYLQALSDKKSFRFPEAMPYIELFSPAAHMHF